MAHYTQPIFDDPGLNKRQNIRLEKIFSKALQYWPSFLLCIIIAVIGAFIYLRYASPVYVIHAKVLVKDDKKGGMAEGQVFQEMGVRSGLGTVDNEIEIFKSKMLMLDVAEKLQLNIHYIVEGKFKNTEIYESLPFQITPLYQDSILKHGYVYHATVTGKSINITDGNKVWNATLGDTLSLNSGKIVIEKPHYPKTYNAGVRKIKIVITPVDEVADSYLQALEVSAVNKQVSIVKISLYDNIPSRGKDVVNELINSYTHANVEDRNRVAENTMAFIDERLDIVTAELSGIEDNIQDFRQRNNITDAAEQSKILLDYSSNNDRQLTEQEVQLSIVQSLENFLDNNKNDSRTIPSTSFVQDLALTSMVNNYNSLQSQRDRLLLSVTETSPYLRNIDMQLASAREDIRNNLASLRKTLQVSIQEMKRHVGLLDNQIKKVPAKERIFLEYARQQEVKQELYLFLMKKREETAISKSSNTPNARVIDVAENEKMPVEPNPVKVFLSAIVLGLLLPSGRVIIKELLSIKISGKEDLTDLTDMTVIAEIGRKKKADVIAVTKNSRSQLSEQFRLLRTNLQFLLSGYNGKIILVTSSMGGEGKSFVSLNLASTLSLSDKKVVVLELDLRKPAISENLGINNDQGFSNYIIGKATLDDIIKPVKGGDFYVISSGIIPPNPAELLMMPGIKELFDTLKGIFDYIIIDTAPVGLVTDAQLLGKYADVTLFVVRQGYTYKKQVEEAQQMFEREKMPKMNIVLNDVDATYEVYGYGEYGRGNGYFDDEYNSKFRTAIKKIKKTFTKHH